MAEMTVSMTAEEVKQAVREWAEKHHGMKPKAVSVTASMEWQGNGVHEYQSPVVRVSFKT